MAIRSTRRRRYAIIAAVTSAAAAVTVGPQSAVFADSTSPGPVLVPLVECMVVDSATRVNTVYFGYENRTNRRLTVPVGDYNQLSPGLLYQGQPDVFNPGRYPRVVAAEFVLDFTSRVDWELNGITVAADATTPVCAAGETGPASDPAPTEMTLNGLVNPAGTGTKYAFEYGTTPALGRSTPAQDFAGNRPGLVRAAVTGLVPQTRYYYRLVTTDAAGSIAAARLSFTTPRSELAISTGSLPAARTGRTYCTTLAATGGRTPYTWREAAGSLPGGLHLDPRTGKISGTPRRAGTSVITFQVSDSTAGTKLTASRTLTLTVNSH